MQSEVQSKAAEGKSLSARAQPFLTPYNGLSIRECVTKAQRQPVARPRTVDEMMFCF